MSASSVKDNFTKEGYVNWMMKPKSGCDFYHAYRKNGNRQSFASHKPSITRFLLGTYYEFPTNHFFLNLARQVHLEDAYMRRGNFFAWDFADNNESKIPNLFMKRTNDVKCAEFKVHLGGVRF